MLLNCGVEDSWEFLGLPEDQTSQCWRKSVLNIHWKDWCWNWNSNTLATWCEELTHWKRLWFWERLKAGRKGGDRGWNGWMASPTRWTWVWACSGNWWWAGSLACCSPWGYKESDMTEQLNWTSEAQGVIGISKQKTFLIPFLSVYICFYKISNACSSMPEQMRHRRMWGFLGIRIQGMMSSWNNAEEGICTQHDSYLVRKTEANSRCAVKQANHSGRDMRHSHSSVEIQSGRQLIRAVPTTSKELPPMALFFFWNQNGLLKVAYPE